jgi:CubicO group peptidase (beta-lactamase class C family)
VGRALQSNGYNYDTRVRDILPEFGLQDELASRECTVADTLSHRTGLPGYHAIWTEDFNEMPFVSCQWV